MIDRDRGFPSRVLDLCVGTLLAAMALYGAVEVLKQIWVPLCIALFVVLSVAALVWYFTVRARRF